MLSHERLSQCLCQFVIDLLMFLVAVMALYFFPRLIISFFPVLSHVWWFGIRFFGGQGFVLMRYGLGACGVRLSR